jgi:hypothetical protein
LDYVGRAHFWSNCRIQLTPRDRQQKIAKNLQGSRDLVGVAGARGFDYFFQVCGRELWFGPAASHWDGRVDRIYRRNGTLPPVGRLLQK